MRIVYSPRYCIDIGPHVFPTAKYEAIHRELSAAGGWVWVEPEAASWEDLALIHTASADRQLGVRSRHARIAQHQMVAGLPSDTERKFADAFSCLVSVRVGNEKRR